MPILRSYGARFHERRISSVTFTSAHLYGNVYMRVGVARALADTSDFGLLGEQSSPKWEISCLGRRWIVVQNMTPLALSSAEKYITVRTNKHTHTKNSKRYITPCLSACVDKTVCKKDATSRTQNYELVYQQKRCSRKRQTSPPVPPPGELDEPKFLLWELFSSCNCECSRRLDLRHESSFW